MNFGRLAAFILAAALSGCAALRVDVDVYKGPLADRIEVQWQEFAELAVAAKPLLVYLRDVYETNAARDFSQSCTEARFVKCEFKNQFSKRINALLSLYEDRSQLGGDASRYTLDFDVARINDGIETLTRTYLERISDQMMGLPKSDSLKARRDAEVSIYERYVPLQTALVSLANKMLVIANNEAILNYGSMGTDQSAGQPGTSERAKSYVALLQGVGNNIISLANELQSREEFKRRSAEYAGAERKARDDAFREEAARVVDRLLADIKLKIANLAADSKVKLTRTTTDKGVADQLKRKADEAKEATQQATGRSTNAKNEMTQYADNVRPILNSYRLVSCKLDPIGGVDPADLSTAIRDALAADCKNLVAGLQKPSTEVTPEKTRLSAVAWLKLEIDKYSQVTRDAPRARFLSSVFDYLNGATAQFGALSGPPKATAMEVLQAAIQSDYDAARDKAQQLFVALTTAQNALFDAQSRQKEAERVATGGTDKAAADKEASDKSTATLKQLQDASEAIAAAWGEFYANFAIGGSLPEGRSVLAMLRASLDGKRLAAGTDELRTRYANAIAAIDAYPAREVAPVVSTTSDKDLPTDRRVVLDQMVAALRYQLMQAESAGETARAEMLRRALDVANDQRAGMAYFRPPSAYLRSVNAATTLQDQTPLEWVNMLYRYSKRAWTPGFLDKTTMDERTRLEIDKQNWQSVNTVFVKGSGDTNYVLAKDDIGNWYVKTYEADPGPIIRSAQGLALFNLGQNFNVNLLRNANLHAQIESETDEGKKSELRKQLSTQSSPAETTAFKRVLDNYKQQYVNSTSDAFASLKQNLQGGRPVNSVREKWVARGTTLSAELGEGDPPGALTRALREQATALGVVASQTLAPANATSVRPKVEQEAEAVWRALRAVVKSRNDLLDSVDRTSLANDAKKLARDDVTLTYKEFIRETVERRQEAIKQFETSIVLIGDSSGQTGAK